MGKQQGSISLLSLAIVLLKLLPHSGALFVCLWVLFLFFFKFNFYCIFSENFSFSVTFMLCDSTICSFSFCFSQSLDHLSQIQSRVFSGEMAGVLLVSPVDKTIFKCQVSLSYSDAEVDIKLSSANCVNILLQSHIARHAKDPCCKKFQGNADCIALCALENQISKIHIKVIPIYPY